MFDSIGVNPDAEVGRRRAGAVMLTLSMLATVGGFVFGISAYYAAKQVLGATDDVPVVEVVMLDEAPPVALSLPSAPAMSRGERSDLPAVSTTMTDEPVALKPIVSDTPVVAPVGDPLGKETGVPTGTVNGKCIGDACGQGEAGSGTGDADIHVFHQSELQLKRQYQPDFPAQAEALGLTDARCIATVSMDDKGVPYSVVVTGCAETFQEETTANLMKWRWYPPKVGKEPTRARTQIGVTYKLR